MKRSKLSHKLAAAATMGMVAGSSADAFAGSSNTQLVDMTKNVITASSGFTNLISTLAYIAGAGLALAGVFKLKQHVDNPAQAPMKDALIRLACGGLFLSLPFLLNVMQGTISNGDDTEVNVEGLQLKGAGDLFNG
jgi:hypothetical protein